MVKKMIKLDPDDDVPISQIQGALIPPPSCSIDMPLYDILNQFQTGKSIDNDNNYSYMYFVIGHLYLAYDELETEVSIHLYSTITTCPC